MPAKVGLREGRPWLVPAAVEFIERELRPGARAFETGAGGSTIWLSGLAASVVTYENSEAWWNAVKDALTFRDIGNVRLVFDREYPIEGIPLSAGDEFDLVLVDGRGRVRTIESMIDRVADGGLLILDNSQRPKYSRAIEMIEARGWKRADFDLPHKNKARKAWLTTVWKKPDHLPLPADQSGPKSSPSVNSGDLP
jgi:predicted O-methyltransferase YrrM